MMVVVGLVKDSLIQLGKASEKVDLVKAVQALACADLLGHFGDVAVGVIDDYLVPGGEDTIYLEPEYRKTNDVAAASVQVAANRKNLSQASNYRLH